MTNQELKFYALLILYYELIILYCIVLYKTNTKQSEVSYEYFYLQCSVLNRYTNGIVLFCIHVVLVIQMYKVNI